MTMKTEVEPRPTLTKQLLVREVGRRTRLSNKVADIALEAVIAIITGNHTEAMQRRGVAALVRGLNDYKKLGLHPTILKDIGEEFTEDV